jgi:chromate transporter
MARCRMSLKRNPSLVEVGLTFATISSTAFGGGQKASIRQQVLSRGWMDRERFMDALEIAQVLPGPNILNLAIYCGQRVRGIPGAIAAFLGASLPPFAIVLIAGALYFKYAANPYVHGGLVGCSAGALGLTVGNALELTWDERTEWIRIALVAVTALAVSFLHMPLLLVLALFGGVGIVHEYLRARPSAPARPRR